MAVLVRGVGIALLGFAVANCAGSPAKTGRHPSELKFGVASSPRVIPEGQPIPKGGGRALVGERYVVAGRTYIPHGGKSYDREGWASWYGTAFHGRLTANGEIFDRESIAAAHPTLPLPSYVRVTNVVNRRSMIVRVNDRGPYERSRLIDLSERAADALGIRQKGTARVRVQFVGKASLKGSDDEKLLATLRTDGEPATLDGEGRRVMLAEARPEQRPARAEPKARREEPEDDEPETKPEPPRRTARGALPEYDEPRRATAPAPPPPKRRLATAEDDDAPPLDIRPPRRPDLGGIY